MIDGVQEARAVARLRPLTCHGMTGAYMLGLVHDAVVYLLEQLHGAHRCQRHSFRFFKQFSQEEDLPVNPSGCARSELYLRCVGEPKYGTVRLMLLCFSYPLHFILPFLIPSTGSPHLTYLISWHLSIDSFLILGPMMMKKMRFF